MTCKTNARLAGFMSLFYTTVTLAGEVLSGPIVSVTGIAVKLASISQRVSSIRLAAVLSMLRILAALFLPVALYAITRDEDSDLSDDADNLAARKCRFTYRERLLDRLRRTNCCRASIHGARLPVAQCGNQRPASTTA